MFAKLRPEAEECYDQDREDERVEGPSSSREATPPCSSHGY